MRREAAEATAQLLLDMQTTVNHKLTEMDTTIKIVHEGKTLNSKNIQLLMTKINMLGDQMQQLQHSKNNNNQRTSIRNTKAKTTNSLSNALNVESNNNNEQQDMAMVDNESTPLLVTQPEENEYDEKFSESPSEFDSIILDAETKKRLSESKDSNGDTAKKKKTLTVAKKTRNRTGRGR